MTPAAGRLRALLIACLLLTPLTAAGAQERGGAEPALPTEPLAAPGQAAAAAAAPATLVESVVARRLNDTVVVRTGIGREERVLYFFDPTAELAVGDELEQGSAAQTLLALAGGGVVELYSSAHVRVEGLGETGDSLRFVTLTTVELIAGERPLTAWLPGGTRVTQTANKVVVRAEPGRLRIRNDGGLPVEVETVSTQEPGLPASSGRDVLVLEQGEEVHLPWLRLPALPLGPADEPWAGLVLRNVGGLELERDGEQLSVRGDGQGRLFTVGGVRTSLGDAGGLVLKRQRPHFRPTVASQRGAAAPATPAGPPQDLQPIDFQNYIKARNKGLDDAALKGMGLWVPPQVREAYEKQVGSSAQNADETDDNTEDTDT